MSLRQGFKTLLGLALLALPLLALAHKPSDSYLFLLDKGSGLSLRWDIALRDLEQAVGLDANRDGKVTWGELHGKQKAVSAYAMSRLHLRRGGQACQPQMQGLQVETHTDGAYAVLLMDAGCASNLEPLQVDYSLLFDIDPTHRGILLDQRANASIGSYILSPDRHVLELGPQSLSAWSVFTNYIREGVHHILIGFDHLLFITMLILPAVLTRREGRWNGVDSLRPALLGLLKVVTAFTVAHSITLSLAVLGVVNLPSRLVESLIALSIVVVALNILYPVITRDHWKLAFGFGLLHGFGFASVLSELNMPAGALAETLLGFNLGVELGQVGIVLLVFPLAYLLRSTRFYRTWVLYGGAFITALLAGVWMIERAFMVRIMGI